MKKILTAAAVSIRLWLLTSGILGVGGMVACLFTDERRFFWLAIPVAAGSLICSAPALLILLYVVPKIQKAQTVVTGKWINIGLTCFFISLGYGSLAGGAGCITGANPDMPVFAIVTAGLFVCSLLAIFFLRRTLLDFFTPSNKIKQIHTMKTIQSAGFGNETGGASRSNKILLKGLITGGLILLMMIPTVFIANLVSEREARQKKISGEVSSKWANGQTLSGPYLYIPYKTYSKAKDGKVEEIANSLWILPENLVVEGQIDPQIRTRSIYKVLLYRSALQSRGNFEFRIPKDIDSANIQFAEAKVCFEVTDIKGIEKKLFVNVNGTDYEMSPGLPGSKWNEPGLSAPIRLEADDAGKRLDFSMHLQIKGSEFLHFVPLAGNSEFKVRSPLSTPSFDGNNLPSERMVSGKGFSATWIFSKANLPFATTLREFKIDERALAFGLTILEPTDQYAKTSRSVKYSILIIGLTFGLFFIVELMQHKPIHPVQYILIGLALVIFYTLLLSISEFILFDFAYVIAALATISLITTYAYGHFKKASSAAIFGGVLTTLYTFIFILIRLEDTALLVGSIGLFVVLALVMFASRRIDWYGETFPETAS